MEKNERNLYGYSDFRYDIVQCGFKRLGNKNAHKNVDFSWNASKSEEEYKKHENEEFKKMYAYWDYGRIWCVSKGSGFVRTTFGDITLEENTAYYIPAGTLLMTSCENYMEQYFVDFMPYSNLIPIENAFTFNIVSKKAEAILPLIKELSGIIDNVSEETDFAVCSIMNAILSFFVKSRRTGENDTAILETVNYINENVSKDVSVFALAKKAGYSVNYFSRIFKNHMGVCPQKYMLDKRLSKAKHLLITSDKSVKTVAEECGFKDPLYFTRVFTEKTYYSPTALRKLFGKTK